MTSEEAIAIALANKARSSERRKLRRAVVRAAMAWEEKAEGDEGVSSVELSDACQALKEHEASE